MLKCTTLSCWLLWAIGNWKTASARRGFLQTPFFCLKTDHPKDSSTRENWLFSTGETRCLHHTPTNCPNLFYLPSILTGPFYLLWKSNTLPWEAYIPLPVKMVFKPEFKATSGSYSFSPANTHVEMRFYINKLLFCAFAFVFSC